MTGNRAPDYVVVDGWKYRLTAGQIERLNGWWDGLTWPMSEAERTEFYQKLMDGYAQD